MTNTNYAWYRSSAVWTIVLMFIVGGFQNITGFLPAGAETVIMAVLGVIASYLHVSLGNKLGAKN